MSEQLDNLTKGVNDNVAVEESAIALIGNLATELKAAIAAQPTDDGAALQSLADTLTNEDAKLAAAITANTPGATGAAAQ